MIENRAAKAASHTGIIMRLLKALFGRTALTILAILLQLLFNIAGIYLIDGIIKAFTDGILILGISLSTIILGVLEFCIALFTTVRITIRDMSPDAKMSWIVVLVFAPIVGSMLYLLFSHNFPTRAKRLLHLDINARAAVYTECPDDCADVLGDYIRHSRQIYDGSRGVPRKYSDVRFLNCGEAFWETLLVELEKAEKYIFMEYFIIEKGKMWDAVEDILARKAAEGVTVKVMYDDIGCLTRLKRNYWKTLRAKGIECLRFNKLRPVLSAVHNNRDHRKITVIDGKVGFVGGVNFADEYINEIHPLGHWKDSAVILRGAAVQNLIIMFLTMFDSQDATQLENYEKFIPEYYEYFDEAGIVQPFGDGPNPLYNTHVAEDVILNMITNAKKYIYITTPYLIIDYNLSSALCRAAEGGVDVRIVTPRIPDKKIVFWITRRNYRRLFAHGVKIYEYTPGFIHAKNYICDDEVGMVGTINMDYRSLVHHFECGVWMYKTECLKDIKADIESVFAESELMTPQSAKLSVPKRIISAVGSLFAPML